MVQSAAWNLCRRFGYDSGALCLLVDKAYGKLAQSIQARLADVEVRCFEQWDSAHLAKIFSAPVSSKVLLLAEPAAYLQYELYRYLDFSGGEPVIPGADSRVLIFPVESQYRMFGIAPEEDLAVRGRIAAEMQSGGKYRITTALGTDLAFEARQWIPLDFEICTAPVESSVNGRIVVDGALFFRKLEEPLIFRIHNGKLSGIEAVSPAGEALVREYRSMTERDMQDPLNRQLAEIGIGFCGGAQISDCFMEAEAAVNTCHFCFGSNLCYGGSNASEFHGASVLIQEPHFERI